MLRSADHDTLIKHQNAAYTNLVKKYNELYTQHNTLASAYSTLANTIPQIFEFIPNPMQITIPPSSAASASSPTTPAANSLGFDPFGLLDVEKFPEIRYWNRKDFSADDVTVINDDNEKVGKLGFLEHMTGTQFTAEESRAVCKHTYTSFAGLLKDGIAPQKWSQASLTATQRVRQEVITSYPEIALCANHWKVDALITETMASGQHAEKSRSRRVANAGTKNQHRTRSASMMTVRKRNGETAKSQAYKAGLRVSELVGKDKSKGKEKEKEKKRCRHRNHNSDDADTENFDPTPTDSRTDLDMDSTPDPDINFTSD
ncbi:hypothetical protein B0H16DRAFT_1470984 [Mycena metata]|uniref:Uncharacterized protein n=1 Tax=Mycena metata TaxID=1033252 RepID=A0AAD7HSK3_9AGAR|nr:hypothetical protein B0H16DRAFT_1470984 [Mycena metata]